MNQTKAIPNLEVEDIDHLGIIAGIVDDIRIVEINTEAKKYPDISLKAQQQSALVKNKTRYPSQPQGKDHRKQGEFPRFRFIRQGHQGRQAGRINQAKNTKTKALNKRD